MKTTTANLGIHIQQYPSGRFGFAGSNIPFALCYTAQDGTPATDAQIKTATRCGPGFAKLKAVTFATREEAQAALDAAL